MKTIPANILENIKKPQYRGNLTSIDSSETQFGLISAGNGEGKVYCLINPKTKIIERVRFLSYGSIQSVSVLDMFCDQINGTHIESACSQSTAYLKSKCHEKYGDDSFNTEDFFFLTEIQKKLELSIPTMVISPPPEKGKEGYKRKDKKDMDANDLSWLPLPAPEKISRCETVVKDTLNSKTDLTIDSVSLYNVEKDLQVIITFKDTVETSQKALITAFIQENMHANCHPQIQVKEKSA